MDEREIRSKSDALQKALSAREPPANIIQILRDLQKGVKPTEELLRKTQVGKIVNKVKTIQNIDPSIPRLASEIISQWRNQVAKSKPSGSGGATPTRGVQNGSAGSKTASPAPQTQSQVKTEKGTSAGTATGNSESKPGLPTGVPLDKRTWKTDAIKKADLTSEPARNNSIGLLYDGLVIGSSLPPRDVLSIARAVESAILSLPESQSSHSSSSYKEKIRSLYQNLKNKSNPELRTRVLSGSITPPEFARMTHDELKSEQQRKEEEKIVKENMNNAMVPKDVKSISDHLECGKCKQKKVSFTQAQTRSADEPMTTFCECMNCGNRWKFS